MFVIKMDDSKEAVSDRKSRSLSICPSTIIASKDWKEPHEHKKKIRAKSVFIGEHICNCVQLFAFQEPTSTENSKSAIINDSIIPQAQFQKFQPATKLDSPLYGVADLRVSVDMDEIDQEDNMIQEKCNFNRDKSGVHISRAANYRQGHPDTPTSPTDKNCVFPSTRSIFRAQFE